MQPFTKKLAAAVLAVAFAVPFGAMATSHNPCPNNRPYYDSTIIEGYEDWDSPETSDYAPRSLLIRFDKENGRELEAGKTVYLWSLIVWTPGDPVPVVKKDGRDVRQPEFNDDNMSRMKLDRRDTGTWYVESNGLAGFQPEPNTCTAPNGDKVPIYAADQKWAKAPLA